MPLLKTYDLFISHAWEYNDDYYSLENLLKTAVNFYFRNYSVPKHDPLIDPNSQKGKNELMAQLEKQVKPVNCVIILGGMYSHHSYWIQKEIQIAKSFNKPIIGIYPRGQINMPISVQENAKKIVSWNTNSIVSAIREISI